MKTKLIIIATLLLTAHVTFAQWGKSKKIEGNGSLATDTRSVGDYDQITLNGFFDVLLVKGNEGEITVEAESNFMEYIETFVDGDELKIQAKKNVNLKPSRKMMIKITVPFKDIDEVNLNGSGDIVGEDVITARNFKTAVTGSGDVVLEVDVKSVETSVTGSGDVVLSGKTDKLSATVTGSGDVSCYKLKSQEVDAKVNGSGDIEISVSEKLYARVSGSGDIDYRGKPKIVDKKTSGSGDITEH